MRRAVALVPYGRPVGNKEALLAAARTCLAEKGYAATSVRDLATTAGVSMAAIGYHFGSRETLLNTALFAMIDEWGDAVARAQQEEGVDDGPAERYRRRWDAMIAAFTRDRTMFLASVEAAVLGAHTPALRDQLACGLAEARRGLAAAVLDVEESAVDDATQRSLGSVQLALVSGVLLQWLTDPDRAPTGEDVARGLLAIADAVEPGRAR